MENNVVQRGEYDFAKFAQEVELMTKVCKQLMGTKHYQSLGEAGIFAILQRSKALNIDPFDALNGGLYYINGKVGMSTELMASLIRRAGHEVIKDPASDDKTCILIGRRCDNGNQWTITFTMEDATKAGLNRNMYAKYPATMLYNRAMSTLARQLFPDVIKGAAYEKDELEEIETNRNVQSNDVKTISIGKVTNFLPDKILAQGCAPLVITEAMEEEMKQLLLQDLDYKQKVDDFLGARNFTSLMQLSYEDFCKMMKRAKERLQKAKENSYDTTTKSA